MSNETLKRINTQPKYLWFFDFDFTLFSNFFELKDKSITPVIPGKNDDMIDNFRKYLEESPTGYQYARPVEFMHRFIEYSNYEYGDVSFCLTVANSNKEYELKLKMMHQYYPDMFRDLLPVESVDMKVDKMKELAEYYGVNISNVIFFDDDMKTIYAARNAGISAWTPMNLYTFMSKFVRGEYPGFHHFKQFAEIIPCDISPIEFLESKKLFFADTTGIRRFYE